MGFGSLGVGHQGVDQRIGELIQGDRPLTALPLLALRPPEGLHHGHPGRGLVVTDDHREGGAARIGALELGLETASAGVHDHFESGAAQGLSRTKGQRSGSLPLMNDIDVTAGVPHLDVAFAHEFQQAFNDADIVIVAPVYAAGEAPIDGVDAEALAAGLKRSGHRFVMTTEGPDNLAVQLSELVRSEDMVICLGAGDITKWAAGLAGAIAASREGRAA